MCQSSLLTPFNIATISYENTRVDLIFFYFFVLFFISKIKIKLNICYRQKNRIHFYCQHYTRLQTTTPHNATLHRGYRACYGTLQKPHLTLSFDPFCSLSPSSRTHRTSIVYFVKNNRKVFLSLSFSLFLSLSLSLFQVIISLQNFAHCDF